MVFPIIEWLQLHLVTFNMKNSDNLSGKIFFLSWTELSPRVTSRALPPPLSAMNASAKQMHAQ